MHLTRNDHQSQARQWASVVLIALLSAGLWVGWFAWDTEYQFDPSTGEMAGPYAIWQGVGAFLCGMVVAGFAHRLLRFGVAALVLPASFTLAWIGTAAVGDVTGLWMVGAILVAFGTTLGAVVLLCVAAAVMPVNQAGPPRCMGGHDHRGELPAIR
ncbi:hypothetical protein [Arthrobacter crusticola]|uniref:hypothetical protein n=1 Tax=Arthrobacter crusticola TaxID=2547960 RepID=UPI001627FA2A|nr:hypothetical protein [Arthrobacter crusticola]